MDKRCQTLVPMRRKCDIAKEAERSEEEEEEAWLNSLPKVNGSQILFVFVC